MPTKMMYDCCIAYNGMSEADHRELKTAKKEGACYGMQKLRVSTTHKTRKGHDLIRMFYNKNL